MLIKVLNVRIQRLGGKRWAIVHSMMMDVMTSVKGKWWMAHVVVINLWRYAVRVVHVCHRSTFCL